MFPIGGKYQSMQNPTLGLKYAMTKVAGKKSREGACICCEKSENSKDG
jgi:hypothetical protein